MEAIPLGKKNSFILASGSPRRIELLTQIGLSVEVIKPEVPEVPKKNEKPSALVKRLSLDKGKAVARKIMSRTGNFLIISADTVVVEPRAGKILGKPRDAADACRMLKLLGGNTHAVYTGFSLGFRNHHEWTWLTRAIITQVTLRKLNSAEIKAYVRTEESMDKAGAYAAQGQGMALVEKIRGSYTNVVGLPISQLMVEIEKLTGASTFHWGES